MTLDDILFGWASQIRIIVVREGQVVDVVDLKNKITDVGLNLARDALNGADVEIKYLGWGKDNTAPTAGDTTLGDEFGRKQVTSQSAQGAGAMKTIVYVAPYEANEYTIEELGWFAGVNATSTPDSGVMVARVLYNRTKSNLESLQVERTDTFSEAP